MYAVEWAQYDLSHQSPLMEIYVIYFPPHNNHVATTIMLLYLFITTISCKKSLYTCLFLQINKFLEVELLKGSTGTHILCCLFSFQRGCDNVYFSKIGRGRGYLEFEVRKTWISSKARWLSDIQQVTFVSVLCLSMGVTLPTLQGQCQNSVKCM